MSSAEKSTHAIRRVLIIFPGALGDLMCVMPAIAAIARRHAGASIELMARGELARLAVGRTVVARGHSIDAREVGELFSDGPSDGARRFFSQFDRVYSFFASDDARFRARLIAATDGEVSFHPFRPVGEGHVSEAYLRAIGEAGSSGGWRLEPTRDDLAVAEPALAHSGCGGSNLIVMFSGSGSAAKNWPVGKFLALAAMLAKGFGILRPDGLQNDNVGTSAIEVVVVLGPAEAGIESVFREAGVAVLKDLELPTVAALARVASAFVGNDSGVSHLAAAVGTSGVVIFGPSDPARWRPLASRPGQRIEIVRGEPIEQVEPHEVAGVLFKICRAGANIID
jgi:heptosyltransferase-3